MEGLIPCPCCDGTGEVCIGAEAVYEPGCGFSHTEPVMAPCPDCEGTGQIMDEGEPAGDWIMQEALEADGEKLRQMTGQDHGPYFFDIPEPDTPK